MNILILGGDGYLGWPTAMHLNAHGHEIAVVDNYLRRRLCRDEDVEPLFEVPNLHGRAREWHTRGGGDIRVFVGDLCDWDFVSRVFSEFTPDAIVHYAEQPSAPYSMLNRPSLPNAAQQPRGDRQHDLRCARVQLGSAHRQTRHHG